MEENFFNSLVKKWVLRLKKLTENSQNPFISISYVHILKETLEKGQRT